MRKRKIAKLINRIMETLWWVLLISSISGFVFALVEVIRTIPWSETLTAIGVFFAIIASILGLVGLAVWAKINSEDPPSPEEVLEATLDAFSKTT